ncbi:MAG: cation diffusion facilitator family transporter [Acidithiobacillus sp.]|nr:cation diffusion facilitator family transporter [Acidithiobacillus sp.]
MSSVPTTQSDYPRNQDHASHHHHHHHPSSGASLLWSLLLILGYGMVEAGAGFFAHSMALLGDAGHMLVDAVALGLAYLATRLARRGPSLAHSYGLGRMEVLAALINVFLTLGIVLAISIEAIQRLLHPVTVDGPVVIVVAGLGLGLNLAVAGMLLRDAHTLNQRAALLHVLGDLFGSLAAVVAGVVVTVTAWNPIDPILSLLISALILWSGLRLLREAVHELLEGTPRHLRLAEVGQRMAQLPAVRSVHDLHIWRIGSERVALTAHLQISRLQDWPQILATEQQLLAQEFGITHVTLQPELQEFPLRRVSSSGPR